MGHFCSKTRPLGQINLLPVLDFPVKALNQGPHCSMHNHHSKRCTRASPPSTPERKVPKILTLVFHLMLPNLLVGASKKDLMSFLDNLISAAGSLYISSNMSIKSFLSPSSKPFFAFSSCSWSILSTNLS
ncbi:hypothetical protein OIU79_013047 [Salix purpurea]|uniref:Uncharacterized protein n=1 Tax=Salix purpurea TaxID=77065 RepID=A0A9Q0T417_SALPP|nr:hypothetical protein OIU79_013047 [Salix purpurea]